MNQFDTSSPTKHNGEVLLVATIMNNVMVSAAEAKLGGLFINAKEGDVIIKLWKKWDTPNTQCQRR